MPLRLALAVIMTPVWLGLALAAIVDHLLYLRRRRRLKQYGH